MCSVYLHDLLNLKATGEDYQSNLILVESTSSRKIAMTTQLTDYRLGEPIHEDSNTIIYCGVKQPEQIPVLIKCVKTEYPTLEDIARLKYEHKILQSLNIAGVVKSYALSNSYHALALILEDFGGEPLTKVIAQMGERKTLPLDIFLAIAIQLAEILAQIHEHQVIHKNLKTANILYNPFTGQVKITDFSITTHLASENQTISNPNLLEGTLAYMSPEQTGRMNRSIDYRTDFYSLGVIFYELLTGQLPFLATEPLELLHCHIAKIPQPLQELNSAIGPAISQIVMKLLAKTAEDRYQNALGLKADLEACLKLSKSGDMATLQVGQLDLYSQFTIPQKLYGREAEVQTLMDAFERVSQGASEMMLVSGYSGIGKTSVVNEVHKPIVRQRGYFIWGKFDQFKRNIPYAALIQAFQELMRQLLTESTERITYWQKQLLDALGPNGQVIIDVIPEVERIIGTQPPVPQLGASESQNRFNLVFGQFIHVFCQKEHPLVLFLDDLQWADSSSLKLIQLLINDPDSQYLLLIGAYRDNEVSPIHPLLQTLAEIEQQGAIINNIILQALHLGDVNQLVADTLRSDLASTHSLAELVFNKTQGNPFFLTQLLKSLYQDQLLWFDFQQECWRWDITKLQGINITDNVVELMISRIQKLSTKTQNILKLAACVGDKFTLAVLSIVNEKTLAQTAFELWESLQAGLVIPLSQSYKIPLVLDAEMQNHPLLHIRYKFLHDRVQQAAYALIPEDQKKQAHLKIGQLLLQNTPEAELAENIFEIVNQLNIGLKLLTQPSQQEELAKLNLIAGQKAKEAMAYESAVRYLTIGLQLLPESSWQTNYDLTLALYVEATAAEFLNINFDRAKELSNIVLKQAKTLLDTVKVYEIQMQFHAQQNQMQSTLDIGLQVLEMLGVSLAEKLITDVDPETLINLPKMTDAVKLAAMRILMSSAPAAYVVAPALFAKIPVTMINLCIEYGNSSLAAVAYGFHGLMLCASPSGIKAGYRFAQLALELLEQFDAQELKAQVYVIFNGHIRHWQEPARATIAPLLAGMQSGLETGALEYAGYNALYFCDHLFFTGEPLEVLLQKQAQHLETMRKLKQDVHSPYLKIWRILLLKLIDAPQEEYQFQGELLNEEELLQWSLEANKQMFVFAAYLAKVIWFYLRKDYKSAIANAHLAQSYQDGVVGLMTGGEHNFYYSLALLALATHDDQELLAQVSQQQEKMQQWAHHAPENYQHKYDLVEAEKARVLGKLDRAIEYYDRAIAGARAGGFVQEEALAAELAAEFYFHRGRERVAVDYLTESYHAYLRWGAMAKIADLRHRYPQVFSPKDFDTSLHSTKCTTELGATCLDLRTVLEVSQALSQEILLDKLLDQLMNSAMENAGARSGFLLLEQADKWKIVAEGFVGQDNVILLPNQPIENYGNVPVGLINYVARSQTTLVLNDATREGFFTTDPYIVQYQPKSVLCAPIVYQSRFKGILYLENNLTKGVFTKERLEVLNALTSQAAIALENASLYKELQLYSQELENKNRLLKAEIQERRRVEQEREQLLISEQQARIAAEDANRIKDEFLAVLSHELRTPLGPILGWVKFLRTRKLDPVATERALETIERNAKLQTQLIDDLLDISRILRGKLKLDTYPVDLASTITAAIDTVQLAADAKSIQIHTVFDPRVEQVLGAASRLQQVIWNLLTNAIKFTDAGGRVEIYLEQVGTQAEIRVQDNGQGISPDFLPHVFESFRQADSSITRRFGGLGLGLAIVRHLVELHGGTVTAESPGDGQGATFIVRLPLLSVRSESVKNEKNESLMFQSLPLAQLQILVVDDDTDTREFITFVLEQHGAKVTAVSSAVKALTVIAQSKPDVLVSDIGMPDMDGYMLIRQIRSCLPEQGKTIPAIALTAYAAEYDQQQALTVGFQKHLAKPVEPEDLVKAIADMVK